MSFARTVALFVRRRPFTIALFTIVFAIALAVGPIRGPSEDMLLALGSGYPSIIGEGHWWAPITSSLLTQNRAQLVISLVGILVLVGTAERLMGTVRTAVAFVATVYLATGVGLAVQTVGVALGEWWSRIVSDDIVLDPLTAAVGTIMAASGFAGPLWRRRIQTGILLIAVVFLLYSGGLSDLYRMLAAVLGLLLSVVYRPYPLRLTWMRSSHREVRTLLATIVAILAVGPVVTVFAGEQSSLGPLAPLGLLFTSSVSDSTDLPDLCLDDDMIALCLREVAARPPDLGAVLLSLLPLLTLLVAAYGLLRGRRLAAWIAIVVNLALASLAAYYYGLVPISVETVAIDVTTDQVVLAFVVSTVAPLVAAGLVLSCLRHFPIRAPRRTIRRFGITVGASLAVTSLLYVSVGWLLRSSFKPSPSLVELVVSLPERFVPVGFLNIEGVSFFPTDFLSTLVYQWVGPVFWVSVIVASMRALRVTPMISRIGGIGEQARLRRALFRGAGSLSFMATWPGNAYWFSSNGQVVIAYRVVNGVAITTSDPVGPRDLAEGAVGDFTRFCDDHGLTPVFYSVHEQWRDFFERSGWQTMAVGEETLIRPRDWSTTGRKWQDIRTSISRAARADVRAEWTTYRALSPSAMTQIVAMSEQWVAEKGLPEMGFTLGGLEELRDPEVSLMIAVDSDDRVLAVTSWLPTYRDGAVIGWTLDFMRRVPESINGVMEFLIAQVAERMRDDSAIEFLSLSAAPLARSGATEDDLGLAPRVLAFMGVALEPVYGFRSLLAFKQKFQPEIHPVFMAYPDPVALAPVGIALARAYLPELSLRETVRLIRGRG